MQITTLKAKILLIHNGTTYKPGDVILKEMTIKKSEYEELMTRNPEDDYEDIPELSEKTKVALKNYLESRKHLKKVRYIEE